MTESRATIELGRRVLRLEAGAVSDVADRLDERFDRAVRLLAAASPASPSAIRTSSAGRCRR